MTNVGEVKKKPGSGIMQAGIVIAVIGAVLVLISVVSGGAGAPLSWGLVTVGVILAGVGYAMRMLKAVERD